MGKTLWRGVVGGTVLLLSGLAGRGQARVSGPPAETQFFPLGEVHAGLKGTGYTVFEGVLPEPFEVEILGLLKNGLGPGRDMILAKLHGAKPEYTGVVAGMSGSPVYVDGKLLGALSYRIGQFSKDPIAGITPIEQMLEVRDEPGARGGTQVGAETRVDGGTQAGGGTQVSGGGPEIHAIEAPLVFGGFSKDAVERFGDRFRGMGLEPVAGLGGVDAAQKQPEPLIPGSAVSAVLVDGDLSITGTCTVSYVDATRLLACGHPITQSGPVEMPMAKAEVLATLASPLNSFKIVNATEIAGAFTEDRASAILGRFGATAAMIPVTIAVRPEGAAAATHTVRLRVLNHRQLTPQIMVVAMFQALQQSESGTAETSYHVRGTVELRDGGAGATAAAALPALSMNGWQTQTEFSSGAVNAALFVGDRFDRIYLNPEDRPVVTAVHLEVETSARRRDVTLESARLSRTEARAGEAIEVEATVRPYRAAPETVRLPVTLPASLQPGPVRLLVADGATVDRLRALGAAKTGGLLAALDRANALHADDRVFAVLLDHTAQAALDAASLTTVPLSMANVLEPLKDTQRVRLSSESVVELGSAAVDGSLTGSQVLTLTIR